MLKKGFILLTLLCVGFLSGCSTRVADMTVASTKNMNLTNGKFVKGQRVIGKDMIPVFFLPLGQTNLKTAIDNAIEKNPCAVGLSDMVISFNNYSFFVGAMGYNVTGNLIIDNNMSGCKLDKSETKTDKQ